MRDIDANQATGPEPQAPPPGRYETERTYTVELTNSFEASSPEDAVRQMIDWVLGAAAHTGYRVSDDVGLIGFYDGDKV